MPKKFLTAVVALSVVMAGALPAFADDHDTEVLPDPPVVEETEILFYDAEAEEHILQFETEEGACRLIEELDVTYGEASDGSIIFSVEVDEAPLEDCYGISVEGPNGQVNHGTFVSSMMHALKELGIKGSDKKEFKAALKGYGKGDMQVKVKDVDDESSLEEGEFSDSAKVKPAKAEKTNKGQAKKANKANKKNK